MEKTLSQINRKNNSYSDEHLGYVEKLRDLVDQGIIRREYESELRSFGKLRNAIIHEYRVGKEKQTRIIAHPLQDEVMRFEILCNAILTPPKAFETITIKKSNMFYAQPFTMVDEVITKMAEDKYSYVPVLEEDRLVGVFSQDTLFSYIASNHGYLMEENLRVGEINDFLDIEGNSSDNFVFQKRNCTVAEVEATFARQPKNEKRLEVIFFTENGKKKETILGMTTIWDLVRYQSQVNHLI